MFTTNKDPLLVRRALVSFIAGFGDSNMKYLNSKRRIFSGKQTNKQANKHESKYKQTNTKVNTNTSVHFHGFQSQE